MHSWHKSLTNSNVFFNWKISVARIAQTFRWKHRKQDIWCIHTIFELRETSRWCINTHFQFKEFVISSTERTFHRLCNLWMGMYFKWFHLLDLFIYSSCVSLMWKFLSVLHWGWLHKGRNIENGYTTRAEYQSTILPWWSEQRKVV